MTKRNDNERDIGTMSSLIVQVARRNPGFEIGYLDVKANMANGTFRNNMSALCKAGVFEVVLKRYPALYRMTAHSGSISAPSPSTQSQPMLPGISEEFEAYLQLGYKTCNYKPLTMHNMHFYIPPFEGFDAYSYCAKIGLEHKHKSYQLTSSLHGKHFRTSILVYSNSSFSLFVRCSLFPVVLDAQGLNMLSQRLGMVIGQGKIMLLHDLPEPDQWFLKSYEINRDMGLRYDLPQGIQCTFRSLTGALMKFYTKKMPDQDRVIGRVEQNLTGNLQLGDFINSQNVHNQNVNTQNTTAENQ